MRICVTIDEAAVRQYDAEDRPLVFGIYWEHEALCYPDRVWTDFGTVLMGWWIGAARRLADGAEQEVFYFMDGPFALHARRDTRTGSVTIEPRGEKVVWRASVQELIGALAGAAEEIREVLQRHGIAPSQQQAMGRGLDLLRCIREKHVPAPTGP